jgi:hypothetical protein
MQKQTLIALILSVLLAAAYLASSTVNTAVITSLPLGNFALVYIVLALIAGFIGYGFASPIQNRLARRLVMIGCFALGLFAGGNAYRAIAIQRLFAAGFATHDDALPIAQLKAGSIGLQSPYTRTVFYLPSTIVPTSQFAGFAYVGKCARVRIDETAGGDKRIVKDGPPIAEADITSCRSQ